MANKEQLAILRQGVEAWNAWREKNPSIQPDLTYANLHRASLHRANLVHADLSAADLVTANFSAADLNTANLSAADLNAADLFSVDLTHANLTDANLFRADLTHAHLFGANLTGANLAGAKLLDVYLADANLTGAKLDSTVFGRTNLSTCNGIETCQHMGPSIIDHRTLQRSGPLPLVFLRGVGLPDALIDYLPSLLDQPIQFYSCFISYSSKDHAFAERLHADLQSKGVRCWFAPEDMKIGDRIGETIDAAIRLRDKLLLILSETSVTSAWVRKEVRTALAEEDREGRTALFPVRLDDAVLDTTEQWADDIRRTRHIGDFTRWKDHDAYSKALARLLRDLKVEEG